MKLIAVFLSVLFGLCGLHASAQNLYKVSNITVIELTFATTTWDQELDALYAADNGDRLTADCTINGEPFTGVGVRYKGNATYSASNSKNPLNIKLDHTSNQNYNGYETLKLSSGNHDPSFLREVLSYEIARNYTVAPQSNYAQVYINGNYHGLYSSSEDIGKEFQASYLYADNDNTRIKCNNDVGQGPFGGGSALEYINADSTSYYDYYELDSDFGWSDLTALISTLENNPGNIESILNIDRAIWMVAFDNVLCNFDSYIGRRQNYYLCLDDNGIFDPILWDMNESFGGYEQTGGGPGGGDLATTTPYLHDGDDAYPLLTLIYDNPTYRRMYIAHCKTILEEQFSNGNYETRALELQALIETAISTDPNALYSWATAESNLTSSVNGGGSSQGAIGITELMDARVTYLSTHADFTATAPTIAAASTSPSLVTENSTFDLVVEVSNATNVILGYRDLPTQEFTKVTMLDDGAHNDGAAGDGTYGYTLAIAEQPLEYFIYAENNDAGLFSPQRAAHEYYSIAVGSAAGDVVINEFMANNDATVADPAGDFDDWIELYNNTGSAIDLTGYYLSDIADSPLKWEFPSATIPANGYLIIWADNDTVPSELHATFKLSAAGEGIYLSNAAGTLLDFVYFGVQTNDVSTGRYPNGTGGFMAMDPTYNAENVGQLTAIGELPLATAEEMQLTAWPNPSRATVNISWEHDAAHRISVYSVDGRMMHNGMAEMGRVQLNTVGWDAGLYFVQVNGATAKMVIE